MRILQISSARSIGGGERHVIDLSNELAKRGHDIFVGVIPGSPLPAQLHNIPAENIVEFPLRNAVDLSSAVQITRFLRANSIELINAHFAKDYPVTAAAARIAGVSFVVTRHVLFPMNRMHSVLLRSVKYVIAPSNAVATSLKRQGLFPDEKIATIRYGLDVENFPERQPEAHDSICVGAVGNLDPVKGFDVVIRAAAIVKKQEPKVKFKIVGEDRSRDGNNEKALRRLIDELDLTDTVELAGFSQNIVDVLAGFDIFVSASRSESFGFVIAEAMLSSVPVIATATEGAKEIISDPSLGMLVTIGSVEDLAESVLELVRDPSKRRELTSTSRGHVHRFFSLMRMVDETEKLYERALKG